MTDWHLLREFGREHLAPAMAQLLDAFDDEDERASRVLAKDIEVAANEVGRLAGEAG